MRKLGLSLAVAALISNITIAQNKNYQVNAVAFYNLENLFHPSDEPNKHDEDFTPTGAYNYTELVYQKKLQNLSKVLSGLATDENSLYQIHNGPAFIGISEIENKQVIEDLINQPLLKDRNYKIIHIESPDARGVDVGMIYRPEIFQVINEPKDNFVDISIRNSPQFISKIKKLEYKKLRTNNEKRINRIDKKIEKIFKKSENDRSATRGILEVTGVLSGDTVTVLVGHWPSRSGGEKASMWKREAAAQVCRNIIDSLSANNPNYKVIVMGDLNDDPINASVTKVLNASGDISKAKENKQMFNPWYKLFKQGIGTLAYNDAWSLFDQIILSYGFVNGDNNSWQYLKPEVYNRNNIKSQFGRFKGFPHRSFSGSTWIDGYSDHFPTIVYFKKAVK